MVVQLACEEALAERAEWKKRKEGKQLLRIRTAWKFSFLVFVHGG